MTVFACRKDSSKSWLRAGRLGIIILGSRRVFLAAELQLPRFGALGLLHTWDTCYERGGGNGYNLLGIWELQQLGTIPFLLIV